MKNESDKNVYSEMQQFADLTKTLISRGNMEKAKNCIMTAEEMFIKGTEKIKNAVVNVYVFSVTSFMETHHCNIKDLLPEDLRIEYCKQVNAQCT